MKGFPGVSASKIKYTARRGRYEGWEITYLYYKARIMVNGRLRILGYYQTKEEAAAIYRKAKSEFESHRRNP